MKQVIRIFRNNALFPEVLFILIKEGSPTSIQENNNVVAILNEDKEVLGYNLYTDSNDFLELGDGYIAATEEVVNLLNKFLRAAELEPLEVDLDEKFVVGFIKEITDHPNSSHLHVCQVDVGDEILQIVCGAKNARQGIKVIVAKDGAVLPSGLLIIPAKLNGIASNGMLCSARELELTGLKQFDGIFELNNDEIIGTLLSEIDWRKYYA